MIKIRPPIDVVSVRNTKPLWARAGQMAVPVTMPFEPVTDTGNDKSSVNNDKSISVTKRRGRPTTGKAMTNAQRQAKFKALRKTHGQ